MAAEETYKDNSKFQKIFGAIAQSVVMSSPVLQKTVGVVEAFKKPEDPKQTRLGNALGSLKDFAIGQSKLMRDLIGLKEFAEDLLKSESANKAKEPGQPGTGGNQGNDPTKSNNVSDLIEYLNNKENPYLTVFNENNVLLEKISKTLEEQLNYTKAMFKVNTEAAELAKNKAELDKVSRIDAARARAAAQPRDAQGRFIRQEQQAEEGGGFGLDDILSGLGMLGLGKGIKRGIRGITRSPTVGSRGLGKLPKIGGIAKGLGRILGPLSIALSAYDIYSTATDETLTEDEKTIGISESVGGLGGSLAGAAAGAAIGSAVPVVGTAAGGILGGILGYFGGDWLGGEVGEAIVGDGTESGMMPEYDAAGNPTGNMIPIEPPSAPTATPTTPPVDSGMVPEYDAAGNPTGNMIPIEPSQTPAETSLLSNEEFNRLMQEKSRILTRMDEIQPIDLNTGEFAEVTAEQQAELDALNNALGAVNQRLEQDAQYRKSLGVRLPNEVIDQGTIGPSSSLMVPQEILPSYAMRQQQLDYLNEQMVPTRTAAADTTQAAPPMIVQQKAPTTINNGGNVTNIIMNNDSLALPQMAFNLPMSVA